MFTPSATLLKALENIYVNADVATVGPMIESLTDSTTNEKNLHITPNAPAIIFGSTLLIKGDDPSVGVYFTKDEEGQERDHHPDPATRRGAVLAERHYAGGGELRLGEGPAYL